MRIAVVILVRNEENTIAYTVFNALNTMRVDRVFVGDNGSSDRTRQLLDVIVSLDKRVSWTDAGNCYNQAELVNELAQEAIDDGANWIFPLDADEFPDWDAKVMRETLAASSAAGYVLQNVNYAPFRFARQDSPDAITRLIFRVKRKASGPAAMKLCTERRIAFLQTAGRKHIWRASRSLSIVKGNHGATGVDGPVLEADACILHAPIRAFSCLARRIENARRLPQSPPGQSWHLKRMLQISDKGALEWEWAANSTLLGGIGPPGDRERMALDFRLRRLANSAKAYVKYLNASIGRT